MSRLHIATTLLAGVLFTSPAFAATKTDAEVDALLKALPVTEASATAIAARCDGIYTLSNRAKTELEARKGAATLKDDFAAFDTLLLGLGDGFNEMYLISQTSTSKEARDAAEACIPKLSDLSTAISLSRPIYDRLAAIPAKGLDEKTAFTLRKMLTNYKLSGVDKDDATRARVAALQTEITQIGLKFAANIRDDKGDIKLKPEDLAGLPQDYLDAHKPAADGFVHLTYDYPDVFPVLDFASKRETRKTVLTGFRNRAWPANETVLKSLLESAMSWPRPLVIRTTRPWSPPTR